MHRSEYMYVYMYVRAVVNVYGCKLTIDMYMHMYVYVCP